MAPGNFNCSTIMRASSRPTGRVDQWTAAGLLRLSLLSYSFPLSLPACCCCCCCSAPCVGVQGCGFRRSNCACSGPCFPNSAVLTLVSRFDRFCSNLLLASVGYMHWTESHLAHHIKVSQTLWTRTRLPGVGLPPISGATAPCCSGRAVSQPVGMHLSDGHGRCLLCRCCAMDVFTPVYPFSNAQVCPLPLPHF